MKERLSGWFPFALLAVLAAMTLWLDRVVQAPARARDGSLRHDPDFIVENFSATRMGQDGMPRYLFSARKMRHYPDDDSTEMEAPRFEHLARDKAPLNISSDHATLSGDGRHIYFMGNVIALRAAFAGRSQLGIYTSFLHVMPDENTAQTDKPVTIRDANTTINSVGLELNHESRTLQLLSRVKASYDKPLHVSGKK